MAYGRKGCSTALSGYGFCKSWHTCIGEPVGKRLVLGHNLEDLRQVLEHSCLIVTVTLDAQVLVADLYQVIDNQWADLLG